MATQKRKQYFVTASDAEISDDTVALYTRDELNEELDLLNDGDEVLVLEVVGKKKVKHLGFELI